MKPSEVGQYVLAILVVTGMALSAISYFASAKDLKQVEQRLEQKILSDSILQISQRIWSLEDRHKNEGDDERFWSSYEDAKEYRDLKRQLEELKIRQLNQIESD